MFKIVKQINYISINNAYSLYPLVRHAHILSLFTINESSSVISIPDNVKVDLFVPTPSASAHCFKLTLVTSVSNHQSHVLFNHKHTSTINVSILHPSVRHAQHLNNASVIPSVLHPFAHVPVVNRLSVNKYVRDRSRHVLHHQRFSLIINASHRYNSVNHAFIVNNVLLVHRVSWAFVLVYLVSRIFPVFASHRITLLQHVCVSLISNTDNHSLVPTPTFPPITPASRCPNLAPEQPGIQSCLSPVVCAVGYTCKYSTIANNYVCCSVTGGVSKFIYHS